ncbi:hypothetical protein F8M41_021334 [Gigaspora margarita]|uniref:Uncharacterized protein n=1 Tax=Gigaspora margarita TaxID=4874 RepID=A0A8H4ETX6_GIGMA|nr:hypothetical protein F8M41_021334 [Gigaspora margarita]
MNINDDGGTVAPQPQPPPPVVSALFPSTSNSNYTCMRHLQQLLQQLQPTPPSASTPPSISTPPSTSTATVTGTPTSAPASAAIG